MASEDGRPQASDSSSVQGLSGDRSLAQMTRVISLQEAYSEENGKWFVYWRLFYMACSELFRLDGGEEWGVAHVLLQKSKGQLV